jgi:hypothetical protein
MGMALQKKKKRKKNRKHRDVSRMKMKILA